MTLSGLMIELHHCNLMNNRSDDGDLPPLHEIEYVPDPSAGAYFGDRKLMRSKKMTQLLAKVLESVKGKIPDTLYKHVLIKSENLREDFVLRGLKSHTNNMVHDKINTTHRNTDGYF
jgi:hypothetical protein